MQEKIIYKRYTVNEEGEIYSNVRKKKRLMTSCGTSRKGLYQVVTLTTIDGKQKPYYVHRLVAEAFIPNPLGYPQVNHIDGNPKNNKANNLEWCNNAQNIQHAYKTGLYKTFECVLCGKEKHPHASPLCGKCKASICNEVGSILAKMRKSCDYMTMEKQARTISEKEIISELIIGKTYESIGKDRGVTRQRIEQIVNSINKRDKGVSI